MKKLMIILAVIMTLIGSLWADTREIINETFDAATTIPSGWSNGGTYEDGWIVSDGAGLVADHTSGSGAAAAVYPADLSANLPTEITFTWEATTGNPQGYKIYLGTSSTPADLIDLGATNTYHLSELLDYETDYFWQIIPYNSIGDALDCPVWSFSTTEDNSINSFPWLENFNSYTTSDWPPVDWTRGEGELTSDSEIVIPAYGWACDDFANITEPENKSARINLYGTARNNWLITPIIDLDNCPDAELTFDIAMTAYGNNNATTWGEDDRVDLVISTDGGISWSAESILIEWNADSEVGVEAQAISVDLAAYSGLIKLGLYGESFVENADNDFFVDNVRIASTSVFPPTNLSYELDEFTVSLNWEAPAEGSPVNYNIYRDGELYDTATATTFSDEITISGTYEYYVTALFTSGESAATNTVEVVVEITDSSDDLVSPVTQLSNYPNPFNPTTTIQFSIDSSKDYEKVALEIYNSKGQKINVLPIGMERSSSVTWNGTDKNNQPVTSGIYLYKLVADRKTIASEKMTLMK